MRKIFTIISVLFILTSCLVDHSEEYLKNASFDRATSTLVVNYKENPDTSLQRIIILSDIRKEGYGVLLNINQAASKIELDSIKYKFKKQDINAVHSFNWQAGDTLSSKTRIAIEGAKFTWLFSKGDINQNDSIFQKIRMAIDTSIEDGGILVRNINTKPKQ